MMLRRAVLATPLLARATKRTTAVCPKQRKFSSSSSSGSTGNPLLETDGNNAVNRFYHSSSIVLAVLTPVAFVLSPSWVNFPVDLTLGVLFPIHSHIALNYVISDYVPKATRSIARMGLLGATLVAAFGILKLNITGPGLTETIKSLWRKKAIEDKKKH